MKCYWHCYHFPFSFCLKQEQYHKILKDYMQFLDTAERKLKNQTIAATNVDDLNEQLQKHKVSAAPIFILFCVHCGI